MIATINKVGGIGASEIAKLFTKQGLGASTAKTLIYEKAVEIATGYRKEITPAAMQNGVINEELAYHSIVKPFFPNSTYRSDQSIPINEHCWATPDVTDESEGVTKDIKCPYTIETFRTNVSKLSDRYVMQLQMQMLATGHENGYLAFFLTSNDAFEYNIPIEKRHAFVPLKADKDVQSLILQRVDEFVKVRDTLVPHLDFTPELDDVEFFNI